MPDIFSLFPRAQRPSPTWLQLLPLRNASPILSSFLPPPTSARHALYIRQLHPLRRLPFSSGRHRSTSSKNALATPDLRSAIVCSFLEQDSSDRRRERIEDAVAIAVPVLLLRRARRPPPRVCRRDTRRVPPPRHEVAPGQDRQWPCGSGARGGGQGQVPADTRGLQGVVGREEEGAVRRRDVRPPRRRPRGGRGFSRFPSGDALAHGHCWSRGARVLHRRTPVHAQRDDAGFLLAPTHATTTKQLLQQHRSVDVWPSGGQHQRRSSSSVRPQGFSSSACFTRTAFSGC